MRTRFKLKNGVTLRLGLKLRRITAHALSFAGMVVVVTQRCK